MCTDWIDDGEHRRVLSNVLQKDGRTKETVLLTLKSAKGIASDGEKARLFMEAADAPSFDDSVSAEYLATVNTIASDGEHARVLMAVLRNGGASKETCADGDSSLQLAVASPGGIGLNFWGAQVRTEVVRCVPDGFGIRSCISARRSAGAWRIF